MTRFGNQQPILRLFGRTAVWSARGWTDLPEGRSADVLATLAAACPQPVSVEQLGRLVWNTDITRSSGAVYTAINRLRRRLGDSLLADAVVTDGAGYRLAIDPEEIDLVSFEHRARRAIGGKDHVSIIELENILDLWAAEPITTTDNELVDRWRRRLRSLRRQTCDLLTAKLSSAGRPGDACGRRRDPALDEPRSESTSTHPSTRHSTVRPYLEGDHNRPEATGYS